MLLGPVIYSNTKINQTTGWSVVSHSLGLLCHKSPWGPLCYPVIRDATLWKPPAIPLRSVRRQDPRLSFLASCRDKCRSHCMHCHGQRYSVSQTHFCYSPFNVVLMPAYLRDRLQKYQDIWVKVYSKNDPVLRAQLNTSVYRLTASSPCHWLTLDNSCFGLPWIALVAH